jgi:hypothetical protein
MTKALAGVALYTYGREIKVFKSVEEFEKYKG